MAITIKVMEMEQQDKRLKVGKDFDQFIAFPLTVMRTVGLNLTEDIPSRFNYFWMPYYLLLVVLANIYCTTNCFVGLITLLSNLISENKQRYFQLQSDCTYTICGSLKLFIFIYYRNRFQSLLVKFRDMHYNSESQSRFVWPKWLVVLYAMYLLACAAIVFLPLVTSLLDLCSQLIYKDPKDVQFLYLHIYQVDYNFNYRTPFGYLILQVAEFLCVHGNVMMHFCPDLLMQCLIFQLCKYYDNLEELIQNYKPERTTTRPPIISQKDQQFLQQIVTKHQNLLR